MTHGGLPVVSCCIHQSPVCAVSRSAAALGTTSSASIAGWAW